MAEYSVDGIDSTIAADSIIHTERGSSKRHKWIYLTAAPSGITPTDNAGEFEVNRVTGGSPAGTEPTPEPLDPADGAAVTDAFTALTTEPTKAATLLRFGFNYRSWFVWNANPGKGFMVPNTADFGLVLECILTSNAQNYVATIHFDEQ